MRLSSNVLSCQDEACRILQKMTGNGIDGHRISLGTVSVLVWIDLLSRINSPLRWHVELVEKCNQIA